jgi:flavin reductase (DIM6/NTAB) family NADH-FMN oxidoreductase RutF
MSKEISHVFKYITQGVYVVSVSNGQKQNAFTAAWVMQVSFDPLLICFSINPAHYSYQLLQDGGVCCISVLNNQQYAVAEHFGSSEIKDKMAAYQWLKTKSGGAPALAESLAYFDCHIDHYSEAGDHIIAVCRVTDAAILNKGRPLLYQETDDMDGSNELYKK